MVGFSISMYINVYRRVEPGIRHVLNAQNDSNETGCSNKRAHTHANQFGKSNAERIRKAKT